MILSYSTLQMLSRMLSKQVYKSVSLILTVFKNLTLLTFISSFSKNLHTQKSDKLAYFHSTTKFVVV